MNITGSPTAKLDRDREIAARLWDENHEQAQCIAMAKATVQTMRCECYSPEYMEYAIEPCDKCTLEAQLTLPDRGAA